MTTSPFFPTPSPYSFVDYGPAPNFERAAQVAGAVSYSEVASADVEWLWPGRIPLGRVTLLVGDPGLGKSLVTLDLAARVSRAAPWPDQCSRHTPCAVTETAIRQGDKESGSQGVTPADPSLSLSPCLPVSPSSVLLLSAEDDPADTIRPRLAALDADCSRILGIQAMIHPDGAPDVPHDFALRRDLLRLNRLLDHMPDCRLLVVDPISAYLGGKENSSADVRNLLAPLAALAKQRRLAVVVVSHLRKKEGAAIYRTMGSLTFVSASRAAWVISRDPLDPHRRLMLPIKNNLASDASGLAYTIEPHGAGGPPVIHWSPDPVVMAADEALRRPVMRRPGRPDIERNQAIQWLQKTLAPGPRPTSELHEEAKAFGFCKRTLERAFRDLDGEAVREGGEYGFWSWKLPVKDRQNPGV